VGGAFPPLIQTLIESDGFHDQVEMLIRSWLNSLQQLAPPLSLTPLGMIATAGTSVTGSVSEGVLVIGIDVSMMGGITTHGDPDRLTDITDGHGIGMWTNAAAMPIAMATARAQVDSAVAAQGATLNDLTFTPIEGAFHIRGHADKGNEGAVDFSFDAIPRLIRPGRHDEWDDEFGEHFVSHTPARAELWFEPRSIEVDIDRPWWVEFLNALGIFFTAGLGTILVEIFVSVIRNNIIFGIAASSSATFAERTQHFTLAGTTEPTMMLHMATFECHPEGTFTGISLTPLVDGPRLSGPAVMAVEEIITTAVRYSVRLPFDAHPDDPMLSIRWMVRRTDTNAIIRNVDVQARDGLTLDLSGDPGLLTASEFRIDCRVYSTLGPVTTDLFADTAWLTISEVLDRSHPFVRWRHEVFTPIVQLEADGSHTQRGFNLEQRVSNLHRTAVPGRCRMVTRHSRKVSRMDDGSGRPHLEYLDALPFRRDQLVARRAEVCDYCFFGGPDKNIPLI
jgi:hypothetical protein